MTASSQLPYPPFELANRVSQLPSDDLSGFIRYELLGKEIRDRLISMLPDDFSFEGKRVLDFGCGAGRTLRHFHDDADIAEIFGCDIDERSIEWLDENLCPPLHAIRSDVDPPLPFEDDSFDFIWAISVFTHLTDNSVPWLLELRRILKPGGLLMASHMGELNSMEITGEAWDEDRISTNVLRHSQSWDIGGPMILMSDWWVDEHWGRAFEVGERQHHAAQTWTMLRKKPGEITAEELVAPGSDPREWRALRHNIAQLQDEVDQWKKVAAGRSVPLRTRLRQQSDRLRRR